MLKTRSFIEIFFLLAFLVPFAMPSAAGAQKCYQMTPYCNILHMDMTSGEMR